MTYNLDEIAQRYSKMDDERLEHIAKYDIADLMPEVQDIISKEIKKRGLNPGLENAIKLQSKQLSVEEIKNIASKIKKLPCPSCGGNDLNLEAGILRQVRSYGFLCEYDTNIFIACKSCINETRKKYLYLNLVLGWWSIQGLYYAPKAILLHFLDKNKTHLSDFLMLNFAELHLGEIVTNWQDEQKLVKFIRHQNNKIY